MSRSEQATSKVRLAVALVGLATAVVTLAGTVATQIGAFGDARIPFLPGTEVAGTGFACDPWITPTLSLSKGSGPSGTEITITGRDYCAGEVVEIRFHTEQIAQAQVDDDGGFQTPARIPGSFDAFAPQQFDLIGTGTTSNRSARVPFQLTTG